jgi:predicted dehydrogenase
MKPIKLGLIGCGIAARKLHWPALKELKDKYDLCVVCNHTETKAKDFANLVGGGPFVTDYQELLQMPELEAVDIVLPINLNYQVTRDTLEAGKHVIVEKPLAANLSDAKKMASFEEKYACVKMVAENYRYRPGLKRIKQLLDTNTIGKPYAVFWNHFALVDENNPYARTAWRINHQYQGGFITDAGVHNIAGLRFLFADIECGTTLMKSVNSHIGELDSFSFQFLTKNNIHGSLNIFVSTHGFAENRLLILGHEGSLRLEDSRIFVKTKSGKNLEEEVNNDKGYKEEFEDFFQAIRHGNPVISSFAEAYRDLEVIFGALNAGQSWRRF